MPLKLTLKPNEKVIIGNAVITNGNKKCEFTVNNDTTILRERDIITDEEVLSPALRIYYTLQLMYMRGTFDNCTDLHAHYLQLIKDFMTVCPNNLVMTIVSNMSVMVMDSDFFQAMKECKILIAYEREAMNHVS